MEPNSLEAGLESLCLDDELSRVVATRLGAIPKIFPSQASPLPPLLPPAAARLAPPTTPAVHASVCAGVPRLAEIVAVLFV